METDREYNTILLWEHWNMKLYKQTGSWQCGGAWEVCELALIPQPEGRYGMRLGFKHFWGGMFVVTYIFKSWRLNRRRSIVADGEAY